MTKQSFMNCRNNKENTFSHSTPVPKIISNVQIHKRIRILEDLDNVSGTGNVQSPTNTPEKNHTFASFSKRVLESTNSNDRSGVERCYKRSTIVNAQNVSDESTHYNSIDDPDYTPNTEQSETSAAVNSSQEDSQNNSNFKGSTEDRKELKICSNTNASAKKGFCKYCKQLFSRLDRHVERKHKGVADVKVLEGLPIKSQERKNLFLKISREGDFIHNSDKKYSTGILNTCRRMKLEKTGEHYGTC